MVNIFFRVTYAEIAPFSSYKHFSLTFLGVKNADGNFL